MSLKKLLLLLPLFTGVPLFLTGALPRPSADLLPAPVFVAQSIESIHPELDAGGLLACAIDRLSPERLSWLQVKVRQRAAGAEVAFESDGTLQLGPNHCARLDLSVRAGAHSGRWLVVSDGHALAHVFQLGRAAPTVASRLLVVEDPENDLPPPSAAAVLRDFGCGGPYLLLKDLHARLREPKMQKGMLQGRPVVRIHGRFDPAQIAPDAAATAFADFCYLYLDAQSLWPGRVEWWDSGRKHGPRLQRDVEFRDPQLNRPLSLPECIRAFSYRPDQG